MTWTELHHKAQELGFELACRTRTAESGGYLPELSSPPANDRGWLCVGSYGQEAGLWAQGLTPQARALPVHRVAAIISGCSEHVGTLGDYDDEFQAAMAPLLAAASHPEHGLAPA
ncbi:hypothetical protein [Sulfuritalea sp.]|uniref:hypothetical protein n=1 Tax=Sulfuritalea sp. TaxID=2480090 RepID=UPI00286EAFC2|nr:hypothetical protein [Sulfuritalea sp.]